MVHTKGTVCVVQLCACIPFLIIHNSVYVIGQQGCESGGGIIRSRASLRWLASLSPLFVSFTHKHYSDMHHEYVMLSPRVALLLLRATL